MNGANFPSFSRNFTSKITPPGVKFGVKSVCLFALQGYPKI